MPEGALGRVLIRIEPAAARLIGLRIFLRKLAIGLQRLGVFLARLLHPALVAVKIPQVRLVTFLVELGQCNRIRQMLFYENL